MCRKGFVETMDSGERGMNPVAMPIMNSRKEYWLIRGLRTKKDRATEVYRVPF